MCVSRKTTMTNSFDIVLTVMYFSIYLLIFMKRKNLALYFKSDTARSEVII